jgi:hypothetical protein
MTEEAKQRLLELKEENRILTPHIVVAEAEKKTSPLHQYFTWDVKKAAYSFWLEQARDLIQEIRVEYMGREMNPFVNVVVEYDDGQKEQGYMSTIEVLSDEVLRSQVLNRALAEIEHWQNKYKEYRELTVIINRKAMSRVARKVKTREKVHA